MKDTTELDRRYQAATWGAMLVVIGIANLIPGVPPGTGLLGIGLSLLALNLARYLRQMAINSVTLILGLLAAALGAVALLLPVLGLPRMELPLIPIALLATGVVWLVQAARRPATE